MDSPARDIARRLGECAEAVCRRYLAAGRKEGRYWLVGDTRNAPGQSLYVRLSTSADGRGAAGKWTDAHTGEHGDLLDIIAAASGHHSMRETLEEARRFLSLPQVDAHLQNARSAKARPGTAEAARRLWAASKPIERTVVSKYLEGRVLTSSGHGQALRFHPSCYYRPSRQDSPDTPRAWPAMIAAVTDLHGAITGVHRTWLDPATCSKAQITTPRRAMGGLLGNGVRFGLAGPVMVAAEGIETTLSLRHVLPELPMIACLSAAHLAAVHFQEAKLGYDVRIDMPGSPLFFQFKLPELMVRDTAREIAQLGLAGLSTPFFRMPLSRITRGGSPPRRKPSGLVGAIGASASGFSCKSLSSSSADG